MLVLKLEKLLQSVLRNERVMGLCICILDTTEYPVLAVTGYS